jgi:hypothetical protein
MEEVQQEEAQFKNNKLAYLHESKRMKAQIQQLNQQIHQNTFNHFAEAIPNVNMLQNENNLVM